MDDTARLRSFPLFADLGERELATLASVTRRQSFDDGERVFSEGEPGRAMYLVEGGRVRISKTLPGMGEEALAILGPGSVFGEMAVLDGSPRSADAIVHEHAEVLVLDRDALHGLFAADHELAYHVLSAMVRTVAGRLRDMNEKLVTVFLLARFC